MTVPTRTSPRFGIEPAHYTELVNAVSLHELAGVALPENEIIERFARAAWTHISEPGDSTAGALVQTLGAADALSTLSESWSADRIFEALADHDDSPAPLTLDELASGLNRWLPRFDVPAILAALSKASNLRVVLLTPNDHQWPAGLADLREKAPHALWVWGNISALDKLSNSVAVVGARASTGYGSAVTTEAVSGLVARGYAIVSGASYGIEGTAQRTAILSKGTTIAVLAGSVDRPYPTGHTDLINEITIQGAVISELPCGTVPTRWRFLARNRLIAAITQATIVMEAGWRSGALNTAEHARTLGRPVGAVPGPVTSAASSGCHRLIRESGAVLVTISDEMAELAPAN